MPAFPDPESRNVLTPDCTRCPALTESRECISWGTGPLDATLVVIGEAPGAGDPDAGCWQGGNWTGMAYTSRHSGRRIRDLLANAGFGSDDCYFTNAVKCFPSDGTGSNREPMPEERENCLPSLREEIAQVEPEVVVATGKHATTSTLSLCDVVLDGFLDCVLKPVTCSALDVTVLPILHPSYQEVWVSRLGYTNDTYQKQVGEVLADLCE